jgi:nucleoid-associated protein YgaU
MNKLEKAAIEILAGSNATSRISVLFNPTEYSIERANTYKATSILGLSSPLLQFVNGEADQLSMELFLEDYTDPASDASQSVAGRLTALAGLLLIDPTLHAPPPVRFIWGKLLFDAIIEKLGRKITMFQPDGTPARATVSVTFKEYRTLQDQLRDPRRESADKSKRRQLDASGALWLLASREYGDPALWRVIATATDLDDPLDIEPGTWLRVPPLDTTI